VKFEGLKNPCKKPKDLQNADLTRPSDDRRVENLDRTREALNMAVSKKTEPAFVSD
jgi:hypothetical protein